MWDNKFLSVSFPVFHNPSNSSTRDAVSFFQLSVILHWVKSAQRAWHVGFVPVVTSET